MNETFLHGKVKAQAILLRWARLLAVGSFLGVLTPWIGGLHYLVELGSHFIPIYGLMAWLSFVILVAFANKRMAVLPGIALLATGATIAFSYAKPETSPGTGMSLRLMISNVLTTNKDYATFIELVKKEEPDVVVVMEINDAWVKALEPLEADYPHRTYRPREDNFGIGILSKKSVRETSDIDLCGVPALQAVLSMQRQRVNLLAVHTLPPVNAENAGRRNAQLKMIADITKDIRGLAIVAGDLNTTMWSPSFRSLVRESELRDARRGFGVHATWPADLAPFMIPIDHCLYRAPTSVKDFRTGPSFGSDHLPLIIDFAVPGYRSTRSRF
ncbi:MAG: endonuclease/exonuclease/phosphatase family protein [Candidatus Hydrogenedentes bacterium]|nr:endonuclease/exonuclease/phosphatase family protein [Candidatus Hydrogenedentota bacterium]